MSLMYVPPSIITFEKKRHVKSHGAAVGILPGTVNEDRDGYEDMLKQYRREKSSTDRHDVVNHRQYEAGLFTGGRGVRTNDAGLDARLQGVESKPRNQYAPRESSIREHLHPDDTPATEAGPRPPPERTYTQIDTLATHGETVDPRAPDPMRGRRGPVDGAQRSKYDFNIVNGIPEGKREMPPQRTEFSSRRTANHSRYDHDILTGADRRRHPVLDPRVRDGLEDPPDDIGGGKRRKEMKPHPHDILTGSLKTDAASRKLAREEAPGTDEEFPVFRRRHNVVDPDRREWNILSGHGAPNRVGSATERNRKRVYDSNLRTRRDHIDLSEDYSPLPPQPATSRRVMQDGVWDVFRNEANPVPESETPRGKRQAPHTRSTAPIFGGDDGDPMTERRHKTPRQPGGAQHSTEIWAALADGRDEPLSEAAPAQAAKERVERWRPMEVKNAKHSVDSSNIYSILDEKTPLPLENRGPRRRYDNTDNIKDIMKSPKRGLTETTYREREERRQRGLDPDGRKLITNAGSLDVMWA